ncbi:MAG: major capsid protein [Verrucomicrobia subdivision 3 bacterium]|nr:major capsid protein [Limisphaerales bacterium]
MAKTKLTDIIVPSVFAPYALERTTQLSRVIQTGAIGMDPEFDALASGPGKTVDMPFWKDLTGESEVLNDSVELVPDKITAGQDTAAVHDRGKAWGANILVKWLGGNDPMARIADLVADWWARDLQTMMLKILDGLFDNTNGVLRTTHRLNIYNDVASPADTAKLTGSTFIDGLQKLGDHSLNLIAVAMHSDVEASLRKGDLISFRPDSEGKPAIEVFQGRRFFVDDACPKVAGANSPAYTTYIFGAGAFAYGTGEMDPDEAVETDRNALASDSYLVNRKRFILHPRGVRWIGAPAGASPTNAELATPTNWSKVYSDKNIRIVAVRHNV